MAVEYVGYKFTAITLFVIADASLILVRIIAIFLEEQKTYYEEL